MELIEKIRKKQAKVAVIGLGYVGLSILEAFAKAGFAFIGYDIDAEKIKMLQRKQSYLSYMTLQELFSAMQGKESIFSCEEKDLSQADVFVITVPTSLEEHRMPKIDPVKKAAEAIAKHLRQETLVIMHSTSYPGTTEEVVFPILKTTNLKVGQDFYLSFVPEISDIGNVDFKFEQVPKIIGGMTPSCYKVTQALYGHICKHIYPCSAPKIAEAAKVLQNAYRLINISFINEMKIAFDRMGIDIWEVIDAAAKKPFGFTPFYPGPGIGGDCIPVDPYYLIWKAKETDAPMSMLERAGDINAEIPHYVLEKIKDTIGLDHKSLVDAKVLVLGVGFKKNVNDTRESAALKVLLLLKEQHANVFYHDPYVNELKPSARYPHLSMQSIQLDYLKLKEYDCVVVLTDHDDYDWKKILEYSVRIVDTRNVFSHLDGFLKKVIRA